MKAQANIQIQNLVEAAQIDIQSINLAHQNLLRLASQKSFAILICKIEEMGKVIANDGLLACLPVDSEKMPEQAFISIAINRTLKIQDALHAVRREAESYVNFSESDDWDFNEYLLSRVATINERIRILLRNLNKIFRAVSN